MDESGTEKRPLLRQGLNYDDSVRTKSWDWKVEGQWNDEQGSTREKSEGVDSNFCLLLHSLLPSGALRRTKMMRSNEEFVSHQI